MLIAAHAGQLPLQDNSVQCVVTSPPYWGLRKYAGEQELVWSNSEGRNQKAEDCAHEWGEKIPPRGKSNWETFDATNTGGKRDPNNAAEGHGTICLKCGPWRGAYGLEPTVELYVQHTVEILREIRRVLRPDGVCFLNLGDSYFATGVRKNNFDTWKVEYGTMGPMDSAKRKESNVERRQESSGALKPKDLCGIPARVALAAQADGWWWRSDIIWAKPNPMPESCRDRPTDAYEHILMLTKSARYFWDAEAVKESAQYGRRDQPAETWNRKGIWAERAAGTTSGSNPEAGRNLRNVWAFATQPYSGAHFATFPKELPRRCILAATSAKGACRFCGAPWERVTRSTVSFEGGSGKAMGKLPHDGETSSGYAKGSNAHRLALLRQAARDRGFEYGRLSGGKYTDSQQAESGDYDIRMGPVVDSQTIGWSPTCVCPGQHGRTVLCVVLDPFAGSGTTGRVAIELNRTPILIDLAYGRASAEEIAKGASYDRLAEKRTRNVQRNLL